MNNKKEKVFVTGIGLVSAAGVGSDNLLKVLTEGRSLASPLQDVRFEKFPIKYVCQVENFNPLEYIKFKYARHMTRNSQFAVAAAILALNDSGIDLKLVQSDRVQIYEGTSVGGLDSILSDYAIFLKEGYQSMDPTTSGRAFIGSTTGELAIVLGIQSRSITICSGSASANDAIGLGFEQIRNNAADIAIVGGSETPIMPGLVGSLCRAGVVSQRADGPESSSRAFTIDRDGFILGEGAGFIILESEKHAKARNAKIYSELAGFGNSCDSYQMLAPEPEGKGVCVAAQRALISAGLSTGDVDYINAHGTGTKLNDKYEAIAFRQFFKKNISDIKVSSTKPITGHLLGASGAIEAIICLMAIKNSFLPPLINYFDPDPECDLNFVNSIAEKRPVNVAMSFNYGFGGKNSVLVFRKP